MLHNPIDLLPFHDCKWHKNLRPPLKSLETTFVRKKCCLTVAALGQRQELKLFVAHSDSDADFVPQATMVKGEWVVLENMFRHC
jgi:hypothetical protein